MGQYSLGFVYVLVNDAMPGMVKIGRSTRLAEDRAKQLHTTAVPEPFTVYSRCLTSHPVELEGEVHVRLEEQRVAPNREFFRVSPSVAAEMVLEVRAEVDGIDVWSATPLVSMRSGDRLVLSLRGGQIFMLLSYPSFADVLAAPSPKPQDVWQAHAGGDTLEIYSTEDAEYVAGLSDNDPAGAEDPVRYVNRESAPNDEINGRERLVPGDRLLWMDSSDGSDDCTSVVFEAGAYCQVIGRTRHPQFSPEGFPLTINLPTRRDPSPGMMRAAQEALKLPPPRSWSPRTNRGEEWVEIGDRSAPPEYWLTQLAKQHRGPARRRPTSDPNQG